MRIMVKVAVVAVMLVFCGSNIAYAMCGTCENPAVASSNAGDEKAQSVIDAGNTVCPVTGEPVDGKTTYVHDGKSYNFCCPACIKPFSQDPEKYIKNIK